MILVIRVIVTMLIMLGILLLVGFFLGLALLVYMIKELHKDEE